MQIIAKMEKIANNIAILLKKMPKIAAAFFPEGQVHTDKQTGHFRIYISRDRYSI